jgi:hypothetical protein
VDGRPLQRAKKDHENTLQKGPGLNISATMRFVISVPLCLNRKMFRLVRFSGFSDMKTEQQLNFIYIRLANLRDGRWTF